MEIKDYCYEIKKVLFETDERDWMKEFEKFIVDINNNGEINVVRSIMNIYKGMGSFNDLVLYKNGEMSIEENIKLDKLRKGLYLKISDLY